jgi:release factor glutamine methyltransferase
MEPPEPATIRHSIDAASQRLTMAGVEQAKRDACLLLGQAFGTPGERFYGREDERLDARTQAVFEQLVDRRFAREPVSRILGARGFWTLDLEITPASLDPRPDSESLIEAVLGFISARDAPLRVLDLGTGTGCLLLSVLAEYPLSTGLGIDISSDCVALAIRNASANGLEERARFQCGDWSDGVNDIFDVIMCNPPYIPTVEISKLAPEVAVHEPFKALDGGADGLDCYRRLSFEFSNVMSENSHIFLEIGHDQRAAVTAILDAAGLRTVGVKPDLAGHDRCLIIKCRP